MPKTHQQIKSYKAPLSAAIFHKKAISVYVAMLFGSNVAQANPEGGEFAVGAGSISTLGNLTTIQQTTERAIVNWNGFGSNAGETVKFVQPSANAAILNRVVGNLPSNLNGLLEGNGRVYLINPNGIVVGANGVVNVNGGFVASTQNVSDSAFMGGGALVFAGESTGSIQILGKVQSSQGDIILIAPKTEIKQSGVLEAGKSIKLVAANEVELSNGKITVKPKATDAGQITVEGALKAAQVQLEAHNNNLGALAINTTGTIRATGTQTNPDGSVTIMAYGEGSNIKVSGNISAQNNDASKQGGRIIVGRNEETGVLAKSADVSGARFTTNKGFVETSGHDLNVDGARVTAKDWLLDPDNIDITGDTTPATAGHSKIKASDINAALNNGTSVTISTTAGSGLNQPAYVGNAVAGDGNILVNASILKNTSNSADPDASLTLIADNGITITQNNSIKSTSGKLDVTLTAKGDAINKANSYGVVMARGSSIDANGGSVVINGTSQYQGNINAFNRGGLYMFVDASISGGNVTIDAKHLGSTNGTNYGAFFDHKTNITATAGDINVTGQLTGGAGGNAIFTGSNPGGGTGLIWSASKNVNVTGNLTGSTNTSAIALYLGSLRIKAGDNVNITANTPNAGAGAIIMQLGGTGWSPGIQSGGDISILANQGSIALNNLDAANASTGQGITGNNITIDNTNGGIQNGVYTKGTGQSTSGGWSGVQLNGVAGTVIATGDIKIFGNSQSVASNAGVNISAGVQGASVTIDGVSKTGNGVYSGQKIESTVGDVKITGVSATSSALSLQGAITANNNVELKGINTDSNNASTAVFMNKAVTSTSGKIDVIASASGTSANALQTVSGGKLTAGTNITLQADSMSLGDTISANSVTGTVSIKTDSADAKIDIGGNDAGSTTTASRTLGLSNAELNRITAGKTVIGDTVAHTGGITVSANTSTASAAGNITLQTRGNILVDKALTIAATRALTLNGAGASSTITQNDAITAKNLELLGDNATHTLTNTGNIVGILAANTKSVEFTNGTELTVGAVNSTTGITATGDVSIATETGNLTIADNVATTATTANAVILNAGKGANVDTDLNSNIVVSSGKSVSVGDGGIAQLMTGSITGSTTAAGLVSPGNFRYNSDETYTNYSKALVTRSSTNNGVNLIYREAPSIQVKFNDVTKAYDGIPYIGSNGLSVISGIQNGDTTVLTVNSVSGSSQGAVVEGQYLITGNPADAKSDLGYNITSIMPGNLTIKANTPANFEFIPSASNEQLLTAFTFGFGSVGGATAAGDEVEGSCDAWAQRVGAGLVAELTLLKSSYLGLRNAKTDNLDALNGGQVSSPSTSNNSQPCGNPTTIDLQASL